MWQEHGRSWRALLVRVDLQECLGIMDVSVLRSAFEAGASLKCLSSWQQAQQDQQASAGGHASTDAANTCELSLASGEECGATFDSTEKLILHQLKSNVHVKR